MSTSTIQVALMCAAITLTALSSSPAIAELPTHKLVEEFGPTRVEWGGNEFPSNPAFGAAVAIRNGVAFVGIPRAYPTSRVAVYGQTATGWVRTATLTEPDGLSRDNGFGRAITFRDGVALIASDTFLHVFRRVNGVWNPVQKLGDLGAMRYENGILAISSNSFVYLYELAANGKFVRRATLRASDAISGGGLGGDVGVAGNTVVASGAEAVYVFRRRGDGTWVETQKLIAADSSPVISFGAAVAIDRGMIIVGAPEHDCKGGMSPFCQESGPRDQSSGGAAYGFVLIGGQYVQVFKLRPGPDEYSNYFLFGRRIAMMGKYIVIDAAINAWAADDPDINNIPLGLAFTYTRDGSTLTARGLTSGYVLNDSMGLANNLLLLGSTYERGDCLSSAGTCSGGAGLFDLNRFDQ